MRKSLDIPLKKWYNKDNGRGDKMGYKEFNKEQRAKDRERHKCITYVDKDKANEILSQYSRKIEERKKFKKYGT